MKPVSPIIKGLQEYELVWGVKKLNQGQVALPVNQDELTDSILQRFRLNWKERIKVLFGQDLYIWTVTFGLPPQWPHPSLSDPVFTRLEFEDGSQPVNKVLPCKPAKFFSEKNQMMKDGVCVPNSQGTMDTLEPSLEAELRRTVKDKLEEADRDHFLPKAKEVKNGKA